MTGAEIVRFIDERGGLATSAQIIAAFDRKQFEQAVAGDLLRRVARGRYATYDVDAARDAAVALKGVISGLSAAQWWDWEVKRPPREPVITVARNRAVKRTGVRVRRRDLSPSDVVDGLVLSKAATVVDCARTLPFDEALAVADSALRDPKVTRAQLKKAADESPRSGRSEVQRVVRLADDRADNPFESCVRAHALGVDGLQVEPQVQVGNVGWADLVDVRLKIVIECDSWEFHSGKDLFRRDVRRYTDMVRRGWLVVRFVWEDVVSNSDRIRDVLTDVVALRADVSPGSW